MTFLLEAGIPVYPVNPKTGNLLRKAAGAKTDRIDAYRFPKTGRFDLADLRRLSPDSPMGALLKTLTRDRDALIASQTRLVNQLTACLKEYYPVALTLTGSLHQRSTLLFLQAYPTPAAEAFASLEELTVLRKCCRYPNAQRAARDLLEELHRPQLVATEALVRAKSRLMLSLGSSLLPLIEDIKSYDKEIRTLFLKHPDHELWQSLPRAASRLRACWGDDRTRYRDAPSVCRNWQAPLRCRSKVATQPVRTNALPA